MVCVYTISVVLVYLVVCVIYYFNTISISIGDQTLLGYAMNWRPHEKGAETRLWPEYFMSDYIINNIIK